MSAKFSRIRLEVDLEFPEGVDIEVIRAISLNILELNDDIQAVRIFDRDAKNTKPKK